MRKENKGKMIKKRWREEKESRTLSTPGLDYTRLFISLTAGAGT